MRGAQVSRCSRALGIWTALIGIAALHDASKTCTDRVHQLFMCGFASCERILALKLSALSTYGNAETTNFAEDLKLAAEYQITNEERGTKFEISFL